MRVTDAAECAQRRAQILMIARREYATTAFMKARDAFAVGFGQTVANVNREYPQFVEVRVVERAQDRIVAGGVRFAIARRNFVKRRSLFISERAQVFAQERKPVDVPIVSDCRNGRLQEDLYRLVHNRYSLHLSSASCRFAFAKREQIGIDRNKRTSQAGIRL